MEEASATSSVLLISKIGAMIGLGFGSLVMGTLPLMVGRYRTKRRLSRKRQTRGVSNHSSITSSTTSASSTNASSSSTTSDDAAPAENAQGLLTSLLLCFGGGVLLFTTFLHLAPEVRASVERHQSNGQLPTLGTLSLAELLFCGGFFFVYLVEEAVHAALTGRPESASEALLYRTVSVRRCNNNNNNNNNNNGNDAPGAMMTSGGSTTTVSTTTRSTWRDTEEEEEDEREARERGFPRKPPRAVDGRATIKDDKVLPAIFVLSPPVVGLPNDARSRDVSARCSDSELAVPELGYSRIRQNHHHQDHHHHQHGAMTQKTSVQGLLTVLALSFHAIFEGLAVGLEPSIGSVMYLAAAIATHKLVISFCVGMELYVAGASTKTTLGYMSIFSMVTPIGIAVGLALGHFNNDSGSLGPTPTILQGMAAGTLLYVVFFEVLARERANEKSGLLQLLAIIVGFALMLGLQIATAHSHSHSGAAGKHGHSHGGHSGGGDHDEHEHEHENGTEHHHHDHSRNETTTDALAGVINRVTDSIVQELSSHLASSATTTPMTTTTTVQQRDVAAFNGTGALRRYS